MSKRTILILGDILLLALITIIGFASHGETSLTLLPRMLTTFLPLLAGWFLLAPWFGLFDSQVTAQAKQLWRPALAMLLAAPLVAILRAAMLNTVALPLFTLILGSSAALGITLWRALFWWWNRRTA
ncbi:MAG: DUF3054 family protein [Anaerolineae bacterium]